MVYQWRPRQMAEVRSLQSQVHNVTGRSASGDRTILPLSSIQYLLPRKLYKHERGISNPDHQHICRHYKEFRQGQEPSLFLNARRSSNSTDVSRTAKHLRAGDVSGFPCVLEKWFTCIHKVFYQIQLRFSQGWPLFISDSVNAEHRFFWHARHVVHLYIWLKQCLSLSVSMGDSLSSSCSARFPRVRKRKMSKQSSRGLPYNIA